tara:strand:+ start:40 stop:510 length:471 start_codon:yes stop_codon:yes gene_type:complete
MAKKVKKPKTRFGYYLIYMAFSINLMAVLTIGSLAPEAFADAENPTCVELGTCMFANDPLNVMLIPFDSIFGGLSIVIFWALAIGILWLRTENPMLVGMVGIAMCAAYLTAIEQDLVAQQSAEFDGARLIGGLLFALSLGITIYHVISNRIHAAPQ